MDVLLRIRCEHAEPVVWERLLGRRGLCAAGELAGLAVGESFAIETVAGDRFAGTVRAHEPGQWLELGVANMFGSELHIASRAGGDGATELTFALVSVGLHCDEIGSFRERWRLALTELLGGEIVAGLKTW